MRARYCKHYIIRVKYRRVVLERVISQSQSRSQSIWWFDGITIDLVTFQWASLILRYIILCFWPGVIHVRFHFPTQGQQNHKMRTNTCCLREVILNFFRIFRGLIICVFCARICILKITFYIFRCRRFFAQSYFCTNILNYVLTFLF